MIMCTERRGAGALLVMVLVLLGVLAVAGGAASVQRSGTGRTYGRLVDGRLLLDAGDAALTEAIAHLRRSADGAGALPGVCEDDWRVVLAGAFLTGAPRATGRVVHPLRARASFAAQGIAIGDVRVDVVVAYPGLAAPPSGQVALPRQGVLELAVRLEGDRPLLGRSARVVRQRWIFYATEAPGAKGRHLLTFVLPPHPLGTVIE